MKWFLKLVLTLMPWCWAALFASEIVAVMLPRKDDALHAREFGRLPVLLGGRIQPFDSVARNSLLQIRSTGDVPLEQVPSWQFWHHPKKLKSSEWLLEVIARPEMADTRPVFLIHHSDLLGELKLEGKGVEKSGLHYFAFNELRPVVDEIMRQGQKAGETKSADQTPFQKQVLKLANAIQLYQRLKYTVQPEEADNFAKELAEFQRNLGPVQAALQANDKGEAMNNDVIRKVAEPVRQFQAMAEAGYAMIVPPLDPRETPGALANRRGKSAGFFAHGQNPSCDDLVCGHGNGLSREQGRGFQPFPGGLPGMAGVQVRQGGFQGQG